MNRKTVIGGVIGFVLGMLVFGLVGFSSAPTMMIVEDTSPLGYEETIQTIQDAAVDQGWKIPTVHSLDESVAKDGYEVEPVSVIELCHPGHAAKILQNDEDRVVTSMMPCRVSVYQTSDGRVVISRMNTGLVSQMFGGNVADVMSEATADTEKILAAVLQ
jgi:uncharacterized protein (DUF302 family)